MKTDEHLLIEAMLRHLPPSGAVLRLLDVGGQAAPVLTQSRADLDVVSAVDDPAVWNGPLERFDAVVCFDCALDADRLGAALPVLRPGGRLIAVEAQGQPGEKQVQILEQAGYVRILVEAAVQNPLPAGVLMRGEKPHTADRTIERIRQTADRDAAPYAGRYVYLLVQQTPNRPVWAMQPGEVVTWQAVAVAGDGETVLLAFSSLPKAVAFMQPAVLNGRILDVNKVPRYKWDIVRHWQCPVMLNPSDELLETHTVTLLSIDPALAETPDE
jgi:hypothetical protein